MSNEFAMQKSFLHDCSYMYFKGINWKSYFPPPTPYKFKYITTWTDLYSIQKKHSKLIVSTDSSWKDFSIAVFFSVANIAEHNVTAHHWQAADANREHGSKQQIFSQAILYFHINIL